MLWGLKEPFGLIDFFPKACAPWLGWTGPGSSGLLVLFLTENAKVVWRATV